MEKGKWIRRHLYICVNLGSHKMDAVCKVLSRVDDPAMLDAPIEGGLYAGWPILIYAAEAGYKEMVQALLKAGANPNVESVEDGRFSSITEAAAYGHVEVVDLLLEAGVKFDPKDRDYVLDIQNNMVSGGADSTNYYVVLSRLGLFGEKMSKQSDIEKANSMILWINEYRAEMGQAPLNEVCEAPPGRNFRYRVYDQENGTTEAGTLRDIMWLLKGAQSATRLSHDVYLNIKAEMNSGKVVVCVDGEGVTVTSSIPLKGALVAVKNDTQGVPVQNSVVIAEEWETGRPLEHKCDAQYVEQVFAMQKDACTARTVSTISQINKKASKPEPARFINYYRCSNPDCGHEWSDKWAGQVDDDCPKCGTNESPFSSDDYEEASNG